MAPKPDFGGYATKAGLRCSDGRVITADAFQHMDGKKVPLVWMHGHKDAANVLGHAVLEARNDGVYAYGFLNNSSNANHTKEALEHGDLDSLSIWANQLRESNKVVSHGSIKEVSLVLSGANPGAKIDHISIQHTDDPADVTELEDEAFISHMGELEFLMPDDQAVTHAEDDETVQDVLDTFNEKQRTVFNYALGAALEAGGDDSAQHSDTDEGFAHQEGNSNMRNVFEQAGAASTEQTAPVITHDDIVDLRQGGDLSGGAGHEDLVSA
jgi:HK97 family phage prohead protease